jgi:hypothetical protein
MHCTTMDFQKNRLVLKSRGCQTDEKIKTMETNQPIEKNGGSFADSLLTPTILCGFWTKLDNFRHSWRNHFPQKM